MMHGGTAPYTFLWNSGSTEHNLYNVVEGDYEVTITDVNGCELVVAFYVHYLEEECLLYIPGAITPNNDGYNDVFFIRGLHRNPDNALTIFNRYGSLVFEASPYQNDWDGVPNRGRVRTDADGRLPAGTYYYILVPEPGEKPLTGYVYLIK